MGEVPFTCIMYNHLFTQIFVGFVNGTVNSIGIKAELNIEEEEDDPGDPADVKVSFIFHHYLTKKYYLI